MRGNQPTVAPLNLSRVSLTHSFPSFAAMGRRCTPIPPAAHLTCNNVDFNGKRKVFSLCKISQSIVARRVKRDNLNI